MTTFLKRFFVALVGFVLLAGVFLSQNLIQLPWHQFLLYTLLPLLLGLGISFSLSDKNGGVLAFSLVAGAIFIYLGFLARNFGDRSPFIYVLLAAAGGAAGVLLTILQVHGSSD